MDITIYHNPRCSKSRRAMEILLGAGVEPRVIEYLNTPPSPRTLRHLTDLLGIKPREMIRTGEREYSELGLSDPDLDDKVLLEMISRHPRLMQRPVVVRGKRAVIGRPPEKILELLK